MVGGHYWSSRGKDEVNRLGGEASFLSRPVHNLQRRPLGTESSILYLETKGKKLTPLDNCLYNPQTKLILYYFYLRYYYQHLLGGSFLFRFYTASLCIRLFCQMQDRLIFQ